MIETLHVFLGDGPTQGPHGELFAQLKQLMAEPQLAELSPDSDGALLLGPAERWTGMLVDGLSAEVLAAALSKLWPVVWLRYLPGKRSFFVLFRGGVEVDRVGDAGGENGDRKPFSPGDPSAWLGLLGSDRNAMRLEQAWAMSGEPEALMENTAAITGLCESVCRGKVPEPRTVLSAATP